MGHESRLIKKFMGHEINSGDFHGKSMGHENRLWRNSWVMKKIPLIHGKFRAKNNPMKFHFAVFMGHEMIFMGFSPKIHGIFIKLQFIVNIETNWTYSCTISLVHLDTQDFFSFTMNVFHSPFSFLVYLLVFCFTWLYYFHIYCRQNLLKNYFQNFQNVIFFLLS